MVVATVRALKMHGGVARSALGRTEDVAAVERGMANLVRHVENMRKFGLPVVVAMNHFTADAEAEVAAVRVAVQAMGVRFVVCTPWADGAAGATDLARAVGEQIDAGAPRFRVLYRDDFPLEEKIRTIAREIYRASDVVLLVAAAKKLAAWEEAGFGKMPVCIAKTQYSFSADPAALGAPEGHVLPVRDVRLSAGAGFVVAICGDMMTMPGLPRVPAAESIGLTPEGLIDGLF